jgi:hypothetical protein
MGKWSMAQNNANVYNGGRVFAADIIKDPYRNVDCLLNVERLNVVDCF